jgi:hypothetical protein
MESAEPLASEKDSYWYIGNLENNQGGKIVIKGRLSGNNNASKAVIAQIGQAGSDGNFIVFSKQEANTQIVSPVLAISQTLDGRDGSDKVIRAGDVLKYTISYQNTGDVGLRDAIVTAEVKGKILDFSRLETNKGSYSSETGIITWKASDVPSLANIAAQGVGKISFSVPVKSIIPVENNLDKNFIVSSIAKIDSPDIPTPLDSNKVIGSNKLELRLASKVLFDTRAYYNDANMKNSGPIPMESGTETTFTVHWAVTNISNDLSETKIVSTLPSGVRWIGTVYPAEAKEKISYDERTNQVVWDAGTVSAGVGIISAPQEIEFQVGVTPQTNQIGQALTLVNKSTLTAKDSFANINITADSVAKNTQLSEDPMVGYANGKVAK